VPAGSCRNAASVGAKTVNGPLPDSVFTSPAAFTADTNVEKSGLLAAVSTMDCSLAIAAVDGLTDGSLDLLLDEQPASASEMPATATVATTRLSMWDRISEGPFEWAAFTLVRRGIAIRMRFSTKIVVMPVRLFAYLSYRDAPRAIAWFTRVGFDVVRRQDDEHGGVAHAELRLGDAVFMMSSFDAEYDTPRLVGESTGRGLYLLVEDVDALYERAIAAGGTSVFEPEDTAWGTRRARVLDPEGGEWSFGSYEPGTNDS
jgi:uncharacterized glyoxalase superfamily protein PhnB